MWIAVLLSILVGVAIVAQNGVNAQLSRHTSLWLLLTIGNVIAALCSYALYHGADRSKAGVLSDVSRVPLAVLVPAFAGFVITSAMPVAISRIGVFRAVILVIGCQIVASLSWDRLASSQPLTLHKLVGAALVVAGAALVMRG